jgi:hypothetical protein
VLITSRSRPARRDLDRSRGVGPGDSRHRRQCGESRCRLAQGPDNQDPDPGQVASAGYVFISYYLTGPGSLTAAKVASCTANGVTVIANFEQAANPFNGTYPGITDFPWGVTVGS